MINLPTQPTNFIGREADLAQMAQMLREPSARLITLLGPGGIGKTRLAVQAAANAAPDFADGVHFVSLQAVRSPDMLMTAMIDALKFSLQGHDDPLSQLSRHLREKELLLILDNFEQLLPTTSIDMLLELLETSSHVKLLVTSREVLNLRQEWMLPVGGMQFPETGSAENAEAYGAVRLFAEYARRIRPDFSLADELANVIRICQIVEGVPLAIELAASWLKSLPCAEIASEIQRNLDFLDTTMRDFPARHRSIRAVFDHSWTLLSPNEQVIFSRLAIFRGGFRRAAAERITGASLADLTGLIDKSLIRVDSGGRYQIHELLRQFAQEKLDQRADLPLLRAAHCAYYSSLLEENCQSLVNGLVNSVFDDVLKDIDNIWNAWDYALEQCREELIDPFLVPLYRLFDNRNQYFDGERTFRRALECVVGTGAPTSLTQARAALCLALCLQNLTRYDEALIFAEQSLPVLAAHHAYWESWNGESCLANIAYARGDYEQAQLHFEAVREMLIGTSNPSALVIVLSRLSDLAAVRGDYEAAKSFLSESVAELEATGNDRSRIRFLITLGDIEHKIGNYDKAKAHFETALGISRSLENTMTHAIALVSLARVAYATGILDRAENLCRDSIALFDEVRHLWGKAFALVHLGRVALELERFDDANQHFHEATVIAESAGGEWLKAVCRFNQARLQVRLERRESALHELYRALEIAESIHTDPLTLDIFGVAAEAACLCGQDAWAAALGAYVAQNVHTEYAARQQATKLLVRLNAESLAAPEIPIAPFTKQVLSALAQDFEAPAPTGTSGRAYFSSAEGLLDALTEREMEILRLLADGHTNQTIAERLIVGLGTIKAHNHNIFSKLGVNNRVQAISRARELRLIQ